MAINDNTQEQAQSLSLNTGLLGQQSLGQSDEKDSPFELHEYLGGFRTEFAAGGVGGETFVKIRDAVTEAVKNLAKPSHRHEVIPVNREDHDGLKFSFLILTTQLGSIEEVVSYYVMILEGTGEKLVGDTVNLDNRQVYINKATCHAYDEPLQSLAARIVAAKNKNRVALSAGSVVVRRTVKWEEESKITAITRAAILATGSKIAKKKDLQKPFRLNKLAAAYRFNIEMAVNQAGVVYDEQGQPMRSSGLLSISYEKKTNTNALTSDTVNRPDNSEKICELSAFVNPIWAPPGIQAGFGFSPMQMGYGQQQLGINGLPVLPTQKLAAELVITGVRTPYGTSTAAVLLALASKLIATDNHNWMQLLLPKMASQQNQPENRVDLTNFGALNVICNFSNETDLNGFGRPVSIKEMKGDLRLISNYITTIFQPSIVTSIDTPEVSTQSWYLDVFGRAGSGDPDAIAEIVNAANEITAGNFGRYFPANGKIFAASHRVPLGEYKLNDQLRDIRDIDLTAVCVLFQNQPMRIHEWNRAFSDPTLHPYTRLAMIEEIIKHAVHDQCEITSYAMRNTFSADFNRALSQGFADLKLTTSISTPLAASQLQTGVAAPGYLASALTGSTNTFTNNAFGGGPINFTQFGGRFG